MKSRLRNQLRAVKQRLDRIEGAGGPVVRVTYPGDDVGAIKAAARAENPGRELLMIRTVYE